MKKGFEIGQSNEIIKTGKIYDLHNIYEFVGVFLNAKKGDCDYYLNRALSIESTNYQ